jgi:hypothetical protein
MPRAIPSRATCRQIPSKAVLEASYAGIPVAARRLAAELMNTTAGGFGRQGHDPAHVGVVPGGSGTVNAFSRNEISV